ncbi:hypothetical protein PT286_00250 [Neisseriaceae bacterium ESL0693]|nr:hypothetical protein [Neisseriaceae bacterium ESL0693]
MVCQKHHDLIHALLRAHQQQQTLMMLDYTDLVQDFDTAYQIQYALTAAKNEPVGGYKLALTTKVVQTIMGTTEPLYGQQVQSRILSTPAQVDLAVMNQPMIGVTLMFTAKTDLSVGMSDEVLLQNVQIAGGLEIIDSRFAHWFPALNKYLMVADDCVGGYMICGQPVEGSDFSISELNSLTTELTLDEQRSANGRAGSGMDSPLPLLQWFLHKLQQHQHQWRQGQVVASGLLFMPVSMGKGEYCAHFSHPRLAPVLLHVDG